MIPGTSSIAGLAIVAGCTIPAITGAAVVSSVFADTETVGAAFIRLAKSFAAETEGADVIRDVKSCAGGDFIKAAKSGGWAGVLAGTGAVICNACEGAGLSPCR